MAPEDVIQDAYQQLLGSVATVVSHRDSYLVNLDRFYRARLDEIDQQFATVTRRSWLTVADAVAREAWRLAGWDDPAWDGYSPSVADAPPFELRIGTLVLPGAPGFGPVPAAAGFVGRGNLMLLGDDAAMPAARSVLESLTLRLIVSTRPGSVRLALADAFAQGPHLSGFLRLPPELRVGDGVAADARQVEELLATLTRHTVDVGQNRLGNLHDSIEGYNAVTTGLAVPYHVLVLSDFPAGISDRSAEMLVNLVRNGPRVGVYVIASINKDAKLPRDFSLKSLTAGSTKVKVADGSALTWDHPDFGRYAVEADLPPEATRANAWLRRVADVAAGVTASVGFARVAVPPERRWAGNTADGFEVQIGIDSRGEPQLVRMGSGAVHHGLVGGAIRMGKSNLLHVLLVQLALTYPPDELELYLVDLKEVEFETYLNGRLPHARAIASRTDREYVLSLLRRFREEIDRRSKLFRDAGCANLPSFRARTGEKLARTLVVFDEYQFLFQHDDRLSDQAGALLEDVARRGAAFGLHMLLTTQSPGGSLMRYLRPVYEQMALRIALGAREPQVSQAILGDGNTAATKLTQPGEAILDDGGNGANQVIRVANLPDIERPAWIDTIRQLGAGRTFPTPATFDPDAPARLEANPDWAAQAGQSRWPDPPAPTVTAWLGEPIEIKPATSVVFERYPRSNLLVAGDEEGGRRVLLATMLSAAVQRSPRHARFAVFDFARPSSRFHGYFDVVRDELPHAVSAVGERTAPEAIASLAAEVERRRNSTQTSDEDIFVFVAGLHRWHDVMAERGYGDPNPSGDALLTVLKEGPELGVYGVVWVDGYVSVERGLRRQTASLFDQRVALHLQESDSVNLVGSPAAYRLGENRALLWSAAASADALEKFKPYSAESLVNCLSAADWPAEGQP